MAAGNLALTEKECAFLADAIDGGEKLVLSPLYNLEDDGFDIDIFHEKCAGHTPLLTIARNRRGWVYGVFTTAKIIPNGAWIEDKRSFLFRLRRENGADDVKQYPAKMGLGIIGSPCHGLCLGSEKDPDFILLEKQPEDLEEGEEEGGARLYSTEIKFYDIDNVDELCGGDHDIASLLVFRVDEVVQVAPDPWRPDIRWTDEYRSELLEEVRRYAPCDDGLGVSNVNILLTGPISAGKSSFFNTVNSIFKGHVTQQAMAGMATRSLTLNFRKYPLRPERGGTPLNFRLCDSMGIEEEGLDSSDFNYLLDGNLKDGYKFNLYGSISNTDAKFNSNATLKDKIHVLTILMDATQVRVMNETVLRKLVAIKKNASRRDIPVLVLLTKVDNLCMETGEDLTRVHYSPDVANSVHIASERLGVPRKDIMIIKNYEAEIDLDTSVDILGLTVLRQMLRLADDFLDGEWDRVTQENERKKA